MLRAALKHGVEIALAYGGPAHVMRAVTAKRRQALVLAYHNVIPDAVEPQGDQSLHLHRRQFAAHLDLLSRTHEVVPLATLLRASAEPSERPRIAITFDDAYAGAVTIAVEELVRRAMPATIFVAPALLGGREGAWWDALADPASGVVSAAVRDHAIHALAGREDAVRAWVRRAGVAERAVHPALLIATESQLHAAARRPGIAFGAHSWSHANLAVLEPGEVEEELRRPLAWLRERLPAVVPWLAYPYGCVSEPVARAAADAGYEGALLVDGGSLVVGGGDRRRIPRLTIPAGLSAAGFEARTAGAL